MKIAIDLDEVLGDFVSAFLRWYNHNYDSNLTKDDVVAYHLRDFLNVSADEEVKMIHKMLSEDGVAHIEPIPGAQEMVKKLAQKHELYLVSARQGFLQAQTEEWINRHYPGLFKELHLANQHSMEGGLAVTKGDICKKLGCDVLIEDGSHHVESVVEVGTRVIILNHPWNSYHRFPESIMRADNWDEIYEYVQELEKQNV